MRKIFTILLLSTVVSLVAQEVPTSFPRKLLLEHFTTEQCGICPVGMDSIVAYIQTQNPSLIWLGHHTGYGKDEYTIAENLKIADLFKVNQAPLVVLNRTIQQNIFYPFSPMELPSLNSTDDTVAEASVVIQHTYDAATRQLSVTVGGQVANPDVSAYLLTVLIKENRLVGKQQDYYHTWQQAPWREFMHARVVRDVLNASAYGDTVIVENKAYSHTLTYTLNEEWVPENCCIVAYITPLEMMPIINAEQAPLVAGTTGGREYMPYGITESSKPQPTIAFDSLCVNQVSDSILELLFIDNSQINSIYQYPVQALLRLYLRTDSPTLQPGTYSVQADGTLGSIIAGYRNDLQARLEGSLMMYVPSTKMEVGDLTPDHIWRVNKGDMIVATDGSITFNLTTYSRMSVKTTYTAPTTGMEEVGSPEGAPKKILRDHQLIIQHEGIEYNVLGYPIR